MNISNELSEIIKKNLPQAVGDELKVVLQKAENDAKALDQAREGLENEKKLNKTLKEQVEGYKVLIESLQLRVKKDEELTQREIKLDLTIAQNNAQQAEMRANSIYQLADIVFRNPRLTYHNQTEQNTFERNPSSGYSYGMQPDQNTRREYGSTTTTIEEKK